VRIVSKYRWSFLSIAISAGTALCVLILIQSSYRRGLWDPQSPFAARVDGFGGLAVVVSCVLACIGLAKERPQVAGVIALCLSMASILFYIR